MGVDRFRFNPSVSFLGGLAEGEDITIDMTNDNNEANAEEVKLRPRSIAKPQEKTK